MTKKKVGRPPVYRDYVEKYTAANRRRQSAVSCFNSIKQLRKAGYDVSIDSVGMVSCKKRGETGRQVCMIEELPAFNITSFINNQKE